MEPRVVRYDALYGYSVNFFYDEYDRVVRAEREGHVDIFEYDDLGNLIFYSNNRGGWKKIFRRDDGRAYKYTDNTGIVEHIVHNDETGDVYHKLVDSEGNIEIWTVHHEND